MLNIIILAAGKGTRMNSQQPKVMHALGGKPFIAHVVDTAKSLSPEKIHLVLGHGAETIQSYFDGQDLSFVMQEQQLGTGHAVAQVLPFLTGNETVLILYGDVPLTSDETLLKLIANVDEKSLSLLTVNLVNPKGYGRILRNSDGEVSAIIEEKDASAAEKRIQEVNTGLMAVNAGQLKSWLPQLSDDNAQGEFYLTDIIALASDEGVNVRAIEAENDYEVQGVNNRVQQAQLERTYQKNIAEGLLSQGLTIMDPDRFDCRGELSVGTDCVVDINCLFEGNVKLGNNVVIGPNCVIKDATVGDNSVIHANSLIDGTSIAENCSIGPFARLRPGSKLGNETKVGNFVETKKMTLGNGSKINHLSYVGDAVVGDGVNIGAGTITCNYDGANKHLTEIGDNVFVGSNSALVAPVSLGKNVTIAAGSTITSSVSENTLAVARQRQKTVENWKRPEKKKS